MLGSYKRLLRLCWCHKLWKTSGGSQEEDRRCEGIWLHFANAFWTEKNSGLLRWRKVLPWIENKLIHFACSHRKNPFVKKIRRHAGKTFWVHTGTIDSCWRMIKASVPDQLTSCPENEQKLNDLIWTYVRTWQWRWEANVVGKALLEKTGAYLAKM